MNYEDLRKYQRMERNASNLAEVDKEFFTKLSVLIKDHKEKYEQTKSIEDLKTLENIIKIARDIFERREQKILMKALRCVRSNEMEENNIVQSEKITFEDLKKILKQGRVDFERLLVGETVVSFNRNDTEMMLQEKIGKIENSFEETKAEDLNTVLVRIVKNIPKFVSSDLVEYGPYEANEIKKIPKKEAELLSKKNFIEII